MTSPGPSARVARCARTLTSMLSSTTARCDLCCGVRRSSPVAWCRDGDAWHMQAKPARESNLVQRLPQLVGVRNNKRLAVVIVLSRLNTLPNGDEEVEVRRCPPPPPPFPRRRVAPRQR